MVRNVLPVLLPVRIQRLLNMQHLYTWNCPELTANARWTRVMDSVFFSSLLLLYMDSANTALHIFVSHFCCRLFLGLFSSLFFQSDTNECVFVWMGGGWVPRLSGNRWPSWASLTVIKCGLPRQLRWSRCPQRQFIMLSASTKMTSCFTAWINFLQFLTATCLTVEIEQYSPLSVLSFFRASQRYGGGGDL